MSYRRRKVFDNTNKLPMEETITKKRYWVVLNNKNKTAANVNGAIELFYRRKDAMLYLAELGMLRELRVEKLEVTITR